MTDRYRAARRLFEELCDLAPEEWEPRLSSACGGDDELRARVESMLRADGNTNLFDSAANDITPALVEAAVGESTAMPPRIGDFELVERLGEGGMGVVFRARQAAPSREVALKIIHAHRVSESSRARFEHEAHLLGRLDHDGIARIYEMGTATTETGDQPYLVMELVDGAPILEFADDAGLATPARLELFVRISDAVEYAHRRGIIHRDLKSANILVNAQGHPKILDFGIARAVDRGESSEESLTVKGELMGTLAYMSPEQTEGESANLDTRTDVYSLGVVLHELLAGSRPYAIDVAKPWEAMRVIRETEPVGLGSIAREFQGDLENIVLKALEKNPERRYSSAAALAEDVRRYLRHEAVLARPATTTYLLRKFARRNRGLVTAAAAVILVGAVGLAVSTMLYLQAEDARAAEHRKGADLERQVRVTRAVNDFLAELVRSANPTDNPDFKEMTLVDALDRAANRVRDAFGDEPEVAAALHDLLSTAYYGQGRLRDALKHRDWALERTASVFGEEHEKYGASLVLKATLMIAMNRSRGAEKCLDLAEPILRPGADKTALSCEFLARALLLRAHLAHSAASYGNAREAAREAGTVARADDDIWSRLHGDIRMALARASQQLGDQSGALSELAAIVEGLRAAGRTDTTEFAHALDALGDQHYRMGEAKTAEPCFLESLAIRERVFGPDAYAVGVAYNNLAVLQRNLNKLDEAAKGYARARTAFVKHLGEVHPFVANVHHNLGYVELTRKNHDVAVEQFRKAMATYARCSDPPVEKLLESKRGLAIALSGVGEHEQAAALFSEVLGKLRELHGQDHESIATAMYDQAGTILAAGDAPRAIATYEAVIAMRRRVGPDLERNGDIAVALYEIGRIHPDTEKALKTLADSERIFRSCGDDAWAVRSAYALARALRNAGREGDAKKKAKDVLVEMALLTKDRRLDPYREGIRRLAEALGVAAR